MTQNDVNNLSTYLNLSQYTRLPLLYTLLLSQLLCESILIRIRRNAVISKNETQCVFSVPNMPRHIYVKSIFIILALMFISICVCGRLPGHS